MAIRGIREIPRYLGKDSNGKLIPIDPDHAGFLQDVRELVLTLRSTQAAPPPPSNLKVTPQAFANTIQWTRSSDADYYELLWSSTPTLANSLIIDVGNSAEYTQYVGQVGIKRYYWIRACKRSSSAKSVEVGPAAGTTLAAGTGVTPPTPPPPAQIIVVNSATGQNVPITLSESRRNRGVPQ